jgi:hypothetical protein
MGALPDTPLILHCHVPKTAGTTLSVGFRRSFGIHHLHHIHSDPFYVLTQDILEQLLAINPCLRSITSHHLRSFPLSVRERPTFLIALLRKPEDTFISQLRHLQRDFSTFPPGLRRHWPNGARGLPLRELARQFLDLITPQRDFSPQTRFFCRSSALAKFGLPSGDGYGLDSYEIAQSILREFHFVGIVDEMKKSMELLEELLAQRRVRVVFNHRDMQNSSPEGARPTWLTKEDEVGRRVLETGKSDRFLYDHFRDALLESHRNLQKHRWLGFRVAASTAREAFRRDHLAGAKRSLVQSTQLFRKRHEPRDNLLPAPDSELSTDLLEERAARRFAKR